MIQWLVDWSSPSLLLSCWIWWTDKIEIANFHVSQLCACCLICNVCANSLPVNTESWERYKTDMNRFFVITITTKHIETCIRSSTCFNKLALNHHRVSSSIMNGFHVPCNQCLMFRLMAFLLINSIYLARLQSTKKNVIFLITKKKIYTKERISLNSMTMCNVL